MIGSSDLLLVPIAQQTCLVRSWTPPMFGNVRLAQTVPSDANRRADFRLFRHRKIGIDVLSRFSLANPAAKSEI